MASTSEGFLPLGGSKLYRHHGFQYEILSTWMIWGNINFRKPQIMLINMDYNIILTSYYIILTIWKLPILYLAGGAITIMKNMKVSWDDDIPNIWENKKCSKPPTRYHIISYIRLWFIIITKKSTVYLLSINPEENCYLTSKDLIKTDDDHGQANGHCNKNIFPVPWNTGGLVNTTADYDNSQ